MSKSKQQLEALEILKKEIHKHGYSIKAVMGDGDLMKELCDKVNDINIIEKINAQGLDYTTKHVYKINECYLEWFNFYDSWYGNCWRKKPFFIEPEEITVIKWSSIKTEFEVEETIEQLTYVD